LNQENAKFIADALINLKYEIITVYFIALCLAILGMYLFSRLKKSAELKEINNNFETVLRQQKELTEATGKIQNSLNKESIYYQVRLNAYHDKSISSITEIYEAIIRVRDSAKHLGFNPSEDEKQKFVRTVSEFRGIFDAKKIWIPKELSEHIGAVSNEIDKKAHKFINANAKEKHIDRLSEENLNSLITDQEKFYDYINQEVVVVFNDLVERINGVVSA
tara:strand:- start:7 stop:666 length:660 start_codon:yes stop_codon:yes gene_type:complete